MKEFQVWARVHCSKKNILLYNECEATVSVDGPQLKKKKDTQVFWPEKSSIWSSVARY
jgi:hypothetical protein